MKQGFRPNPDRIPKGFRKNSEISTRKRGVNSRNVQIKSEGRSRMQEYNIGRCVKCGDWNLLSGKMCGSCWWQKFCDLTRKWASKKELT